MSHAAPTRVRGVSDREKRHTVVLLRGLLVVAVGGLLVDAGIGVAGLPALALVVAFALSDLLLLGAPLHLVGEPSFELTVGAVDLVLVGLGIHLAGAGAGALPISCLLMALVAALANHRSQMAAGAAAVGALHAWLALGSVAGAPGAGQLGLQILFLCSVGLYYATLTENVHLTRRREQVEELERHEMATLLEILDCVSSSLDETAVARAVVAKLDELVPSLRCSLLFVDDMSHCYVLASNDAPDLGRFEVDLAKYPEVREALATQQPVVIDDTMTHPLTAPVREQLLALDYRSIVVVPLLFGHDVLGILCLRAARSAGAFNPRELRLCRAVARASANALKNSILHRQVLEQSEQRRTTGETLSRILNHSPDLILTTDAAGRITESNRAALQLLGCTRDELLGRPSASILAAGTPDLAERVRASGVIPNLPARLCRRGGGDVEVELHLSVLDDGGPAPGTLWIGRDVTELKAAQLQLIQAEKLSTIGKVISGVAHELNNPLSAVLGYSQLLMARGAQGAGQRELERIHEGALRCQKIVRNLLSFSRHHKPERKRLGLNGILEKTLDLKKYQLQVGDIEVTREFARDLPLTWVDFHQMQQVFLNLLQNAQHAIHAARRPGKLVVRTTLCDATIRVAITDNGTGMDAATLERVFDPFFTTKQQGEGTGLGLSVSYGIVSEHGGRIWATSREGVGTTFFVELPVADAERTEDAEGGRPRAEAASAAGRILVVDDEPLVLDLLVDVLESAGHRVDTASNGDEACRKAVAGGYDLVITDVHLPRMSGMQLYREILARRPEMKDRVVFVTGDLNDAEVVDFLAQLNARALPKPLDLTRLTELVQQVLPPAHA